MADGRGIEPLSSFRLLLRYWLRRPVPVYRLYYQRNIRSQRLLLYPTELTLCGGEGGIRTHGAVTLDGFQDRCNKPLCHFAQIWSIRKDSNLQPFAPKANILPIELRIVWWAPSDSNRLSFGYEPNANTALAWGPLFMRDILGKISRAVNLFSLNFWDPFIYIVKKIFGFFIILTNSGLDRL